MFSDVSLNERIYRKVILFLKVCAAITSFVLTGFVAILLLNKFENNYFIKVIYITCIYVMIISIEKTLKFLHKFFKPHK